jgi:hypothetical protein
VSERSERTIRLSGEAIRDSQEVRGDEEIKSGGAAGGNGARELAYAVLICLAGAGLALFAATRTWTVEVSAQPAPLPALRTARTGGSLLPWLPPLAVVGLAGTGALIATRGAGRRVIGVLLVVLGAGLVAGGGYGVPDAAGARVAWPVLCALGGLPLGAGGVITLLRGHRWPGMSARYERAAHPRATQDPAGQASDRSAAGVPPKDTGGGSVTSTQAWDALDRGEDPFDPA